MLIYKDYERSNWECVTWQIFSSNYVSGFVESETLPPTDYLHWLIECYGLRAEQSVMMESCVSVEGRLVWRIKIRQAYEHHPTS